MKAFQVARWEFLEKVKTRTFLISLIMLPLIVGLFSVVPGLLLSRTEDEQRKFGIIDQTDSLRTAVEARLGELHKLPDGKPLYILVPVTDSDRSLEHLKKLATGKILENEFEGYFILPDSVMTKGEVEFRGENVGNIRDQERFSRVVEDVIIERRLQNAGFDASRIKQLTTKISVKTIKISSKGEERESGFLETFMSGYIFIMMLVFLVLSSGQMLIRSVVEEKSNRIVEVLMSSCSSRDLMVGKIIGLSLLGITSVTFWVLILIGANVTSRVTIVSFDHLILLVTFFLLGYLLYSALFVAVGSSLSTEQEAQQMTSYVSLVLVFPVALAVPAMQNPESTLVKVLTLIPLFAPTFMALRLSIQMPEAWEIILSLLLLILSIIGMMWAAAKIFRIGILITGKRPHFKEIIGWLTANV